MVYDGHGLSDAELGRVIREINAAGYIAAVKFGEPDDG